MQSTRISLSCFHIFHISFSHNSRNSETRIHYVVVCVCAIDSEQSSMYSYNANWHKSLFDLFFPSHLISVSTSPYCASRPVSRPTQILNQIKRDKIKLLDLMLSSTTKVLCQPKPSSAFSPASVCVYDFRNFSLLIK